DRKMVAIRMVVVIVGSWQFVSEGCVSDARAARYTPVEAPTARKACAAGVVWPVRVLLGGKPHRPLLLSSVCDTPMVPGNQSLFSLMPSNSAASARKRFSSSSCGLFLSIHRAA